ncbi:MAG: HepT-like ribonuclease domain-containing protein, partial [Actinomycetota bacterium]
LLDIGRHILAKGYSIGVTEYKEIARRLQEQAVLSPSEAALLITLAGYRNRLVHFYHEVTDQELYGICSTQSGDIETILAAIQNWMKAHPEMVDQTL